MPNVNKVTVMGVLGRDPETKQFPNGGSITTFSVATTEFWKDKTTRLRVSTSRKEVRRISRAHCVLGSTRTKAVQIVKSQR